MPVIINSNEITLIGVVGGLPDEGFDSAAVIQALAVVGRETAITVRINSGGGIATEGAAIHAALKAHKGKVSLVIEGIAASAASLIALAGSTVTARSGAVFMIHEPAAVTFGDARTHQKTIEALDTLADAYAGIYADRTRKPTKAMRALMQAETWMTAEEAKAAGFIDRVDGGQANDNDVAAFAYGTYAKAPARLVALAQARGWQRPAFALGPRPQMTAEPPSPPADPVTAQAAREWAAEVARLCCDGGAPDLMTTLIRERVSLDEARARIAAYAAWKQPASCARN